MPMFGKVEDLVAHVVPRSRLQQGLLLLQEFRQGRSPQISQIILSQKPGEVARLSIEGDALYVLVQCYKARAREQGRFEAHQRHTDLQYLCQGQEWIEVCDLQAQPNLPGYDTNGNLYFPPGVETRSSRLLLQTGNVAVLFPNDAHAPCLRVEGDGDQLVRKIVVKVKDAGLANGHNGH